MVPVTSSPSGVEDRNSRANCLLNRMQCSPSGFVPVETRFGDYKRTAPLFFRPPTGFMPVDARFENFADLLPVSLTQDRP